MQGRLHLKSLTLHSTHARETTPEKFYITFYVCKGDYTPEKFSFTSYVFKEDNMNSVAVHPTYMDVYI